MDDATKSARTAVDSQRIKKAAASLSTLERDVLSLSSHLGLRNDEIAKLFGISEWRVERLLARALHKFDRAFRSE